MDPVRDSTIDEFVRLKLEGESYTEIRARLSQSGVSEEELKVVMKKIDERVLRAETGQGNLLRSKQWYRAGLITAVAGLIIAVGFNAGIILTKISRLLVYTPFFAGIVLMFYGRILQRSKKDATEKGPGRIRSKRPYK